MTTTQDLSSSWQARANLSLYCRFAEVPIQGRAIVNCQAVARASPESITRAHYGVNGINGIETMDSPCIKVCVIDTHTHVCSGCHRSLSEIASWTQLTAAERSRISASLPARARTVAQSTTRPLARSPDGPLGTAGKA